MLIAQDSYTHLEFQLGQITETFLMKPSKVLDYEMCSKKSVKGQV